MPSTVPPLPPVISLVWQNQLPQQRLEDPKESIESLLRTQVAVATIAELGSSGLPLCRVSDVSEEQIRAVLEDLASADVETESYVRRWLTEEIPPPPGSLLEGGVQGGGVRRKGAGCKRPWDVIDGSILEAPLSSFRMGTVTARVNMTIAQTAEALRALPDAIEDGEVVILGYSVSHPRIQSSFSGHEPNIETCWLGCDSS